MTHLNWGMIGGGVGSQIGPAHRLGARLDGAFFFVAGALYFWVCLGFLSGFIHCVSQMDKQHINPET